MFQKFFRRPAPVTGPVEYLVVGLGNPGSKYDGTRHNTGFMAIDRIAEKAGGKSVLLLKPSTFMNLSGQSVQEAMQFYKLPAEKVIVLFDDISLPVGRMRIRMKGSDGGHNGMKNIIYLSGKDTFPRIKLGIGAKPNPGWDLADWVLSRFTEQEQKQLSDVFDHAAEAVALMVNGNSTEAMNRFNGA